MFVDSHCHLDFPELATDLDGVLARMRQARVTHALCVCVRLEDFDKVHALATGHDNLFASVGVHPDYERVREPDVGTLVRAADDARVLAIGETGLDYFRISGDAAWQRERFRIHVRAAREAGKPLIVHTRAASEDTIRILREERAAEVGGVMHCFTEAWDTASAAIDMGFMISFSGIITFKSAEALRAVAARVPEAALLIETDAPYLAPVPHRGKTNEPSYVPHVATRLASLRGTALEQIAAVTTDNFFRLFNIQNDLVEVNSKIGPA